MAFRRCSPPTASALSLPALICALAVVRSWNAEVTVLLSKSFVSGADPR